MTRISKLLLVSAAAVFSLGASYAQNAPAGAADTKVEATKSETPKVYHSGGRHDVQAHEASEKAKAKAKAGNAEQPVYHAGGRHDEASHKAAVRAQQKPKPAAPEAAEGGATK